ncbi:hypothetical protein GWK47_022138 [Chionoecetes opilio]|uniref:Uncharacterized protein n=1 Tax=Chionoecetes opilio TaxID=41210 RepID=A0A8J5CKB0_CHIOP|nr:hypothetical protein GWK47_022138 [Chionoecetes opilio]
MLQFIFRLSYHTGQCIKCGADYFFFFQPSDAESSVVSATQSPTRRAAPRSPPHTHRPDWEEYNSDASTDMEDNATAQPCPKNLKPQTQADPSPSPTTSIPETPPYASHNTTTPNTPTCFSPNTSIPETPASSFPKTSKTDTPTCFPSNKLVPQTQTSPNKGSLDTPVQALPMAPVSTPPRADKDDHSAQGSGGTDSVFKKPLAASPRRVSRSPLAPACVASSSKSSPVTKDCRDLATQLFSADNSDDYDLDAPTQVFTHDTSVDLDAPTQVFTHDTSVDLDAPTQVFTHDTSVDLDAPTQVFTHDTSVDLDAPTQVFTSNVPSHVDLDAPTQVFTHDTSVDLDAPTQVFTHDTSVDLDAPTQVFTHDTSVDLDAPTQVFTHNTSVDLDAPTQVFTSNVPSHVDLDAPTQVFTSGAPDGIDPDAPTQVFTSGAPDGIDPDAPTQVFTSGAPDGIDPDAPTQVFTSGAPDGIDPDAPTQVFTSGAPDGIDPDAPTQVFTSGAPDGIDPDAPTQVFTSGAPDGIDPDAPTQVFTSGDPDGIDPDAPTQVFTSGAPDGIDPDAPTQVFTSGDPDGIDPDAPTQVFTSGDPDGIDPDAPTQVFTSGDPDGIDPDAPTQVFTSGAPDGIDPDAPTQVFTSDDPDGIDPDAPTQVFTSGDPDVCGDTKCAGKMAAGSVRHTGSHGSTQLSLQPEYDCDDPPGSPTLLCDPDDTDALTQPFLGFSRGGPGPDGRGREVRGPPESDGSLPTNTVSLGLSSKEDLQESDASESLFNDEDEVDSDHDEGEAGVLDRIEEGHKPLKGDDYHSDESTDLEDTLTDALPQSSHKGAGKAASSLLDKDKASEGCDSKGGVNKEPHDQSLEGNSKKIKRSLATCSSSTEAAPATLPGQSSDGTKSEIQPRPATRRLPSLPLDPCTPESMLSQESTPANVSLSECSWDMSEEITGDSNSTVIHKPEAEQPDWLSDSESEGNGSFLSVPLFDLPSDTEGDDTLGRNLNAPVTPTRRQSTRHGSSRGNTPQSSRKSIRAAATPASCASASAAVASPKHSHNKTSAAVASPKHSHNKTSAAVASPKHSHNKTSAAVASPKHSHTKTSAAVASPKHSHTKTSAAVASPKHSHTKTSAAVASPKHSHTKTSAAVASPKHSHTKTSDSPSLTSAANCTHELIITTTALTATTTTTTTPSCTTTHTPTQASAPPCVPVPSLPPPPATRRQTRRGKVEAETSTATPDPDLPPIATRRRSKRNTPTDVLRMCRRMPTDEGIPARTITNTVTTSVSPPTITSTTTVTTTDITTTATPTPPQEVRSKRRNPSQRVTVQPVVNASSVETEAASESQASPQPQSSAATGAGNSASNTRARRGRRAAVPPITKIKSEVTEDENVHLTSLTTIKQEEEEAETPACTPVLIKTEPPDDLPQDSLQGEGGRRSRRTCHRPERFSPDRDGSVQGRKLRSKTSLPSSASLGRVPRETTGSAGVPTTQENTEAPQDVPTRQRRSRRVLSLVQPTTQEEAAPEVTTLAVKVKKEREDSDAESLDSVVEPCTSSSVVAGRPARRGRQPRASTSRAAPPRAAKKIKIEVIHEEESDNLEDSQGSVTQPSAKQKRISYRIKKEPIESLSQNSPLRQRSKRTNSEASDSASLSNGIISSRATRSNKDVELWSPSKRQRQASAKPRVLFTGYHDPADHKIVTDLEPPLCQFPPGPGPSNECGISSYHPLSHRLGTTCLYYRIQQASLDLPCPAPFCLLMTTRRHLPHQCLPEEDSTAPIARHHQHGTISTASSARHHQHGNISRVPLAGHHQHGTQGTIIRAPSAWHHKHGTISTAPLARHHKHGTISTAPSAGHHQHGTISTAPSAVSTAPSAGHHQHGTISMAPLAGHQQHGTISRAPSAWHH